MSGMSVIERVQDLMVASATVGDLKLFRCLSYILGPPTEWPQQYERALVSACDAGQTQVVATLLEMGVTPLDGHALECAMREGHNVIVDILSRVSPSA